MPETKPKIDTVVTSVAWDGKPYSEGENQIGVTNDEAAFLYGLVMAIRPKSIAEIGTGVCRSLKAFHDAAMQLKSDLDFRCTIYTCDIANRPVEKATLEFPDVHAIHGNSRVLADKISIRPDLVFIDGDHSYDAAKADYDAMKGVCNSNCVFVFHDTILFGPLNALMRNLGGQVLPTPRGIGIIVGSG